ncbi:MAG: rod shape-determining protein RodA [Flavobacteriaceae bacterium]|nr:rod shape-determining protein RodA [Flavobacteriaceae bacterium]
MRKQRNNIFYGADLILILLYISLILLGLLNIYSVSSTSANFDAFSLSSRFGTQLLWIAVSIPIVIFVFFLEARIYERFATLFYLFILVVLAGLFVFGKNINGATSWYSFGAFNLQPSEFAKAITALALAKIINESQFDLRKFHSQWKVFLIVLLPAILIALQPDPGSSLVYLAFFFVFYREGLPWYYIFFGMFAVILFILTMIFGKAIMLISLIILTLISSLYIRFIKMRKFKKFGFDLLVVLLFSSVFVLSVDHIFNYVFEQHHRDRFMVILGKTSDTKGIGYNTDQSVLTIGSGGLIGKGFMYGDRTRGKFVPEQDTDYIFSTIGEEWGFVGTSVVVIIFTAFLLRILYLAEKQKNKFSRVYGYCVASIFFLHFMINIGMVIGLLPTIGIPLPFFSYGGSAFLGFTILLFIFIKLDANKVYEW